jgi:hypothetical protein
MFELNLMLLGFILLKPNSGIKGGSASFFFFFRGGGGGK